MRTFGYIPVKMSVRAALLVTAGCGQSPDQAELTGLTQQPSVSKRQTLLIGNTLPKFVDELPTFNGRRQDGTVSLSITMQEFQQKVLPASVYAALAAPYNAGTYLWGYNINNAGPSWPARTIEAKRNVATTAVYSNSLVNTQLQSLLTVDQTLRWADPLGTTAANNCVNGPPLALACTKPYTGPIPTVVHLHGAEVLSQYDGNPDAWFTPGLSLKGPGFFTNTYNYVNSQEATTLWFHDHALGIVRENVYSGMAGFYFIRDNRDTGAANNPITLPAGDQEVELLVQDRQFDTNGQLFFPDADTPAGLMADRETPISIPSGSRSSSETLSPSMARPGQCLTCSRGVIASVC